MARPFNSQLKIGIQTVKMGVLILTPIFLMFSPADYFDQGQSISLFALLGVENYYSEGLTRACMHLLHFDFQGAMQYNRLSFVVVPLLVVVWGSALWQTSRRLRQQLQFRPLSENQHTENEKAKKHSTA